MALSPVMAVLRASITDFQAKMGEARAEVAKLETESKTRLAGFQAFGKFAAIGVAAAVAGIGVESVKMAGDFQAATSVLQTAAGETSSGLAVVRKGILDIASSTGTTWQNLSEGMYQIEKAGFRGADGLRVLDAAAKGAKEENADLGVVANAMTSIMAAYNIPTSKSVQVMNALKTAAGQTKDTMQNFSSSLSAVLPIAATAHLNFAQVGGALAALTRPGTSAQQAAQNLAFAIKNLEAPSKVAINTMAQFGISSTDVSQKLSKRGLGGTLEYLVDTIGSKMGPAGLVLQGVFKQSKAAGADLSLMMQNMSPETQRLSRSFLDGSITIGEYRRETKNLPVDQLAMARQFAALEVRSRGFSDALKSGTPEATTMADVLRRMTGGSAGLNTALSLTGQNQVFLNDATRRTSESMHNASSEVEGWKQTQDLLNTRMDRFRQTIEAAAINLGTKLIPVVSSAIDWLSRHRAVVEVLVGLIGGGIVLAIGAFVGSFLAANAVVIAAIAAAAGLVTGLIAAYKHFGSVREIVGTVVRVLREGFGTVVRWITDTLLPHLRDVWSSVWGVVGRVARAFVDGPVKYVRGLLADFQAFWKAHGDELVTIASHVWRTVTAVVETGIKVVLDFLRPAMAAIRSTFKFAWDAVVNTIRLAWDLIKGVVRTGLKVIEDILGLFADFLTGHWSRLWGDVKKLVADAVSGIWNILRGFAANAGNLLFQAGKDIVSGLINGVRSMAGAAAGAVADVARGALDAAKGLLGIKSPSTVFHEIGTNVGQGFVNGINAHRSLVASAAGGMALTAARAAQLPGGGDLSPADAMPSAYPSQSGRILNQQQMRDAGMGGETHITVYAQTSSPAEVAQEIAWAMKTAA